LKHLTHTLDATLNSSQWPSSALPIFSPRLMKPAEELSARDALIGHQLTLLIAKRHADLL
jgi:hypothetical protein